jgi:hypothetical protein
MRPIVTYRVGWLTYLRIWIEYFIWGYFFKRNKKQDKMDRCSKCHKLPGKHRLEINIQRIDLHYALEFCEFLCYSCAMQLLYRYKDKLEADQ